MQEGNAEVHIAEKGEVPSQWSVYLVKWTLLLAFARELIFLGKKLNSASGGLMLLICARVKDFIWWHKKKVYELPIRISLSSFVWQFRICFSCQSISPIVSLNFCDHFVDENWVWLSWDHTSAAKPLKQQCSFQTLTLHGGLPAVLICHIRSFVSF